VHVALLDRAGRLEQTIGKRRRPQRDTEQRLPGPMRKPAGITRSLLVLCLVIG
jgi:hypothetical protein